MMSAIFFFASFVTEGVAASPPASPPPAAPQLVFEQATQAAAEGKCSDAISQFENLLQRPSVKARSAVTGAIQARLAPCLLKLDRVAEAESLFLSAEQALPRDQEGYAQDLFKSRMSLGSINLNRSNRPGAEAWYRKALEIAPGPYFRIQALNGITRATMFDPDDAALKSASEAMAVFAANANMSKDAESVVKSLHARALLNHGQMPQAYAELKSVLKANGGLTLRVDANDVISRSDLAIAALLNGDAENAKKYLAYTGAGRLDSGHLGAAVRIQTPACGGPNAILPDDMAIIGFGIAASGAVTYAEPVYATRLGGMADEFAQAVMTWSWKKEDVAKIPPLLRMFNRVELRCSNSGRGLSPKDVLESAYVDWASKMVAGDPDLPKTDAKRMPILQDRLKKAEAEGNIPLQIDLLRDLGNNMVVPDKIRQQGLNKAFDLAEKIRAPVQVRALLSVEGIIPSSDWGNYNKEIRNLLSNPDYMADTITRNVFRLMVASPIWRKPPPEDAQAVLQAIIDDNALAADHPLKVAALVRIANLLAEKGNLAAAQAAYQRTGLDATQCSLLDATPALRMTGIDSSDFPEETKRWGFDGWVRTEYDIQADGKSVNHRAIAVYPPLVFRDAAVKAMRGVRYRQTFRPEGALGCRAMGLNIQFLSAPRS